MLTLLACILNFMPIQNSLQSIRSRINRHNLYSIKSQATFAKFWMYISQNLINGCVQDIVDFHYRLDNALPD
jgi:hypothetical protein